MIKKIEAQIKTNSNEKNRPSSYLTWTHLSLTNPTLTLSFVILVLIYGWGEQSWWDPLDRGSGFEGLKL
jgi:hypothetical protein